MLDLRFSDSYCSWPTAMWDFPFFPIFCGLSAVRYEILVFLRTAVDRRIDRFWSVDLWQRCRRKVEKQTTCANFIYASRLKCSKTYLLKRFLAFNFDILWLENRRVVFWIICLCWNSSQVIPKILKSILWIGFMRARMVEEVNLFTQAPKWLQWCWRVTNVDGSIEFRHKTSWIDQ